MKLDSNSRLQNTVLNQITGFGGEMVTYFLTFITRTVFIYTLGKDYLGIGGLFTNILTMLSLAELGIHEAMNYRLYRPLKENDQERLLILMTFYKRVYMMIGAVVFVIGLCIIPFLKVLIKDYSIFARLNLNAGLVFTLYLLHCACGYSFFAYKSAIVKAAQKGYYIDIVSTLGTIVTNIAEIVVLLVFRDYLLYAALLSGCSIFINFICAGVADKMFPFLRNRTDKGLSPIEKKDLFKDCGSITLFSLSSVVVKATDNLVLSAYIGLGIVGLYSNYLIIYNALKKVIKRLFRAAEASVGNLFADAEPQMKINMFFTLNFAMFLICGSVAGCVALLSDEFILAWIGDSFVIPRPFALLLGIELLIIGMKHILEQMRNVTGIFQKLKYRPLCECILNVVISIIGVQYIGICGVLLGTIISEVLTVFTIDPYIISKHGFNERKCINRYYAKGALYLLELAIAFVVCLLFCKHYFTSFRWISWFIHATFSFNFIFVFILLCNYRTDEFKTLYRILTPKLKIILRKQRKA